MKDRNIMKGSGKWFLIFACWVLVGCSKFSDGTSVWQGGLWIIPWVTFGGACYFGYMFYKTWTSGWRRQTPGSGKMEYGKEKLPFYKNGYFWFSAGLLLATVIIVIMVNTDK